MARHLNICLICPKDIIPDVLERVDAFTGQPFQTSAVSLTWDVHSWDHCGIVLAHLNAPEQQTALNFGLYRGYHTCWWICLAAAIYPS